MAQGFFASRSIKSALAGCSVREYLRRMARICGVVRVDNAGISASIAEATRCTSLEAVVWLIVYRSRATYTQSNVSVVMLLWSLVASSLALALFGHLSLALT